MTPRVRRSLHIPLLLPSSFLLPLFPFPPIPSSSSHLPLHTHTHRVESHTDHQRHSSQDTATSPGATRSARMSSFCHARRRLCNSYAAPLSAPALRRRVLLPRAWHPSISRTAADGCVYSPSRFLAPWRARRLRDTPLVLRVTGSAHVRPFSRLADTHTPGAFFRASRKPRSSHRSAIATRPR
ncbi:hypothetical protein DFH06DRAFT_1474534 [Mycena polygramma]|nr:hypothetical protein DFH06DRAFT_1474534 [Mycena polygramma]